MGCWLPEGLMASGPVTVSGVSFQSDVQRPVKSSGAEVEAGNISHSRMRVRSALFAHDVADEKVLRNK